MKNIPLSVVLITKNAAATLKNCLYSICTLTDDIVIVDDYSTDDTLTIARNFKAKIFMKHNDDLGLQKAYAISKAKYEWILQIDADEFVSTKLLYEVKKLFNHPTRHSAYFISFQNHYVGRPLKYGGENYRMPRLFYRKNIIFEKALVHERAILKKGTYGSLKNKIYHYSYRGIGQMYRKFTDYALREARQKKTAGEKTSIKKIFFYPPHMFWARFIKDKGYKDGFFRIPLDLGFAYMEFVTYIALLFIKNNEKSIHHHFN